MAAIAFRARRRPSWRGLAFEIEQLLTRIENLSTPATSHPTFANAKLVLRYPEYGPARSASSSKAHGFLGRIFPMNRTNVSAIVGSNSSAPPTLG